MDQPALFGDLKRNVASVLFSIMLPITTRKLPMRDIWTTGVSTLLEGPIETASTCLDFDTGKESWFDQR